VRPRLVALVGALAWGCASPAPPPADASSADHGDAVDAGAAMSDDATAGMDAPAAEVMSPDVPDVPDVPAVAMSCADVPLPPADAGPGCGQPAPTIQDGPTAGMKRVPAGPFWRGCNRAIDSLCAADEGAGACVSLSAFEIDATEVTQQAYAACVTGGGCTTAHQAISDTCRYNPTVTPNLPIACVDWNDAVAYCRWAGKRLPTEAEWEKAARGTDGRMYPWGNEAPTCERANLVGCHNALRDVGSQSGDSPYGLKDMAGNVWEWVADWYEPNYYAGAPACAPPGPASAPGAGRVGRGGGFEFLPMVDGPAIFLRTTFRHPIQATTSRIGIGFRCARSLD
jgi:formylglycine-generating enzyme required for sulfatase activity